MQAAGSDRQRRLEYYLRLRPEGVPLTTFGFDIMHYAFAEQFVQGKLVLDAATGKGYGAYHLAIIGKAKSVTGVDLDEETLNYARRRYRLPNVFFERMDVTCMQLPSAHFDVVTCFETMEHIHASQTDAFLTEVVRVLKPGGIFVISTPNRPVYSAVARTEGHINEMNFEKLNALLSGYFMDCSFYCQGRNWLNRIRRRSFCGAMEVGLSVVIRRLPRLSKAVSESLLGRKVSSHQLDRLANERRVRPALRPDDVQNCLLQVAVCRKPRKRCFENT